MSISRPSGVTRRRAVYTPSRRYERSFGLASRAASAVARCSGSHRLSSSRKATNGDEARRTPTLRTTPATAVLRRRLTATTRGSSGSGGIWPPPSSTMMTRLSAMVCESADSTAARSALARLYVGMTVVTSEGATSGKSFRSRCTSRVSNSQFPGTVCASSTLLRSSYSGSQPNRRRKIRLAVRRIMTCLSSLRSIVRLWNAHRVFGPVGLGLWLRGLLRGGSRAGLGQVPQWPDDGNVHGEGRRSRREQVGDLGKVELAERQGDAHHQRSAEERAGAGLRDDQRRDTGAGERPQEQRSDQRAGHQDVAETDPCDASGLRGNDQGRDESDQPPALHCDQRLTASRRDKAV